MDKNEQKQKTEEIKRALHDKDYETAAAIADTLDIKKIKDNNLLNLMADAYELNHNYETAKEVLLAAYDNTTTGRHIAYKLCLLSIKTKDIAAAKDYYEDFVEMAPRDTSRYVLKYNIAKAQNRPIKELIVILEEYVHLDMEEKWAYELAKLYHIIGDKEKCVDICDEICLWFAEGKYVFKAMDLKKMYSPLTLAQQEKYDEKKKKIEREAKEAEERARSFKPFEAKIDIAQDIPEIKIEPEIAEEDIQAVVADGIKEILGQNKDDTLEEIVKETTEEPDGLGETRIFAQETNNQDMLGETKVFGRMNGEMEEIIFQPVEEKSIEKTENEKIEEEKTVDESAPETKESVSKTDEPQVDTEAKDMEEEIEKEEPQEVVSESITEEATGSQEPEVVEEINDIGGVADILRQLQARGILKAETVERAVNIIDEAITVREELKEASIEKSEPNTDVTESAEEPEEEVAKNTEEPEEEVIKNTEELQEETIESDSVEENPIPNPPMFDLEFATQELPKQEELSRESENEEVNEISEKAQNPLKVKSASSAKVEIISGAGIVEEGELEISETEEEETSTEKMEETENLEENAERKQKQLYNEEILPTQSVVKEEEQTEISEQTDPPEEVSPEIVLTEEDLSVFKNYLNLEGFETNIKDVLQDLIKNYTPNGKSTDGNIIIMGSEKTGKTTLAIEIVKLVNSKRGRRNRKLAKVKADVLNRRGFRNVLNKLLGSDLIIENAELLGPMTLSEIADASGMFTDDMIIILEGEIEGMTKILHESQRVSQVFNHVITVREYDIKEWAEYGKRYAREQGYRFDELANLAFYKAIDDFFGANNGIGKNDVESIVDDAISKSRRLGRKLTGIFSSKRDDEGLNILVESDFNV